MELFAPLLRDLARSRFANQQECAKALGIGAPFLSQLLNGHKPPPLKAIEDWAKALGLEGPERETFIFSAKLATSPSEVHQHIDALEAKISRLERDVASLRSKLRQLAGR